MNLSWSIALCQHCKRIRQGELMLIVMPFALPSLFRNMNMHHDLIFEAVFRDKCVKRFEDSVPECPWLLFP